MKIGIESQRIFRKSKHGMDVVAMEQIRQLQRMDSKNEYLLFAKDGEDKTWLTESRNLKTVLVQGVSYADWEQLSLPLAVKKYRPDLLHCTANTAPYSCSVPLIVTVHDVIYIEETSFGGSAYQDFGNLYRRFVVPHAIKAAKKVITVSQSEKDVIARVCKTDPDKIEVIYNGVSERFQNKYSKEDVEKFRTRYQLPERFILFFGNTAPKKNTTGCIHAYIEYCSAVNDPLPVVIGDYPQSSILKILNKVNRPELIRHFHAPGYISPLEMPLLYNCSTLFLYPSFRESFGLPVLEAMASGVPVITSDIPPIREIAGDAAIFVNPQKPAEIAQQIELLLKNPDRVETLIHSGLQRVQSFTWESSAKNLLKIYESLV
jgi:glycosyltransferase involved in cell wall biosynthesis